MLLELGNIFFKISFLKINVKLQSATSINTNGKNICKITLLQNEINFRHRVAPLFLFLSITIKSKERFFSKILLISLGFRGKSAELNNIYSFDAFENPSFND